MKATRESASTRLKRLFVMAGSFRDGILLVVSGKYGDRFWFVFAGRGAWIGRGCVDGAACWQLGAHQLDGVLFDLETDAATAEDHENPLGLV